MAQQTMPATDGATAKRAQQTMQATGHATTKRAQQMMQATKRASIEKMQHMTRRGDQACGRYKKVTEGRVLLPTRTQSLFFSVFTRTHGHATSLFFYFHTSTRTHEDATSYFLFLYTDSAYARPGKLPLSSSYMVLHIHTNPLRLLSSIGELEKDCSFHWQSLSFATLGL